MSLASSTEMTIDLIGWKATFTAGTIAVRTTEKLANGEFCTYTRTVRHAYLADLTHC